MDYNIIDEYVSFVKKEYLEFFKMIFKNNYKKSLCASLLDRYINVRYYDETNYSSEKDFVKRLNKELVDIYKEIVEKNNEEYLKNAIALFGYIIYFDDVFYAEKDLELINSLVNDKNIKIAESDDIKTELKDWYIHLKETKDKFNDSIVSREFRLIEKKLMKKLYYLELEHSVKISNLYSEYAINRAYNTGTVAEDKLFITYILTSFVVLNNALNLDFSVKYVVPFAKSLFEKDKKIQRLIGIFDNPLAKKNIAIRLKYDDYKKYKAKINKLINEGYSFGLDIPDDYSDNINDLVLFTYIFVNKDADIYDTLINEKTLIDTKIIKI